MTLIQKYLNSPEVLALAKSSQDAYGYSMKHFEKFCAVHYGGPVSMPLADRIEENVTAGCEGKGSNFQKRMPDLATYLEKAGLSGNSVQQNLTNIKIFLKWAGHPVDYSYKIKSEDRKANQVKHMNRWFNENDIAKCLAYEWPNHHSKKLYCILVRLLIETGARINELANIRGDDIDLEDMTIRVNVSKTAPRPIFFSPETKDLIIKFKKTATLWEDNLFPGVNRIKKAITEMLTDLGLKKNGDGRGAHTFRSWTCTTLLYSGVRIEDISLLAGTSVDMIRERYIHPTPLMLREKIRKGMGWEY